MNKRYTYKYTKRFHNCITKLLQISAFDRILLDWLAEQMDGENKVFSNKENRKTFINFMIRVTNEAGDGKTYKDSYIKNSIGRLKAVGFIIAPVNDERGWFWVNPLYYFKGNIAQREAMIAHIESRVGDLI